MNKLFNKHEIYMNMIKEYSKFSKCQFTKVGAMAVNSNGRVIATGVNGTLPGTSNCTELTFKQRDDHIKFTLENEIHAEENLILELATSSMSFSEIDIYVTLSPCHQCLKHLLGLTRNFADRKVKVNKIIYDQKYHRLSDNDLRSMRMKAADSGTRLMTIYEAFSFDTYKTLDIIKDRVEYHFLTGVQNDILVEVIKGVWYYDSPVQEILNRIKLDPLSGPRYEDMALFIRSELTERNRLLRN